jgi:glycosyltransferase involved in cell wall biosynthesis
LSSLWEGLPISLLEAQFFGIASVVTDVGGNPEVIKNGHNGLLVPPRDADKMADAILRIIIDEDLRNELGLKARQIFAERYSLKKMATNYLNTIHGIMG